MNWALNIVNMIGPQDCVIEVIIVTILSQIIILIIRTALSSPIISMINCLGIIIS